MTNIKDLHTCGEGLPTSILYLRKAIKVLKRVSPALATSLVTSLFCKPVKKKIGKRQASFYASGTTEELKIRAYTVKVFRKGSGPAVFVAHGWNSCGYGFANRPALQRRAQVGGKVARGPRVGRGRRADPNPSVIHSEEWSPP